MTFSCQICSDKVGHSIYLVPGDNPFTVYLQNKPNGQYQLEFDGETVKGFMHDLPIRKIPGIGRVTERLLEAIGVKVRQLVSLLKYILSEQI